MVFALFLYPIYFFFRLWVGRTLPPPCCDTRLVDSSDITAKVCAEQIARIFADWNFCELSCTYANSGYMFMCACTHFTFQPLIHIPQLLARRCSLFTTSLFSFILLKFVTSL